VDAVYALTLSFCAWVVGGQRYHRPMGSEGDDAAPTGAAPTELGSAVEETEAHTAWSLDDGVDWPQRRRNASRPSRASEKHRTGVFQPPMWRSWSHSVGCRTYLRRRHLLAGPRGVAQADQMRERGSAYTGRRIPVGSETGLAPALRVLFRRFREWRAPLGSRRLFGGYVREMAGIARDRW
jgi:hypothetical protein